MKPFGYLAAINCYNKNDKIRDPKEIKKFIINLVDLIGMVRHGECRVERFGEGEIEGWSAFQFIETSSITFHNDEKHNRAFIDVFSCKDFDYQVARDFCQQFFESNRTKMSVLSR